MPKQNHVPLLNDVFFPFQSHLRLLPRRRQTPRRQQIATPAAFGRPCKELNLCPSTAVSNLSASSSPTFSTYSTGRADKNKNPPIDFLSSGVNSNSRSAFSASNCALHFSRVFFSSNSTGSLFFFKSFSTRSSRRVI